MHKFVLIVGLALSSAGFAADPAADTDVRYPREFSSPQGTVVTHAPQIEGWTGYEMINGLSAVEVTLPSATEPAYGAIYYTANTITDLEKHTVSFYNIQLNKVRFPSATAEQSAELEALLRDTLARKQLTLPLDLVLTYLDEDIIPEPTPGLAIDPPEIIYATTDSRLLSFDGEPRLAPIQKTELQFAVNTNWDVFYVEAEKSWYLLDGKRWLVSSGKKLKGKWQPATELPAAFNQLPNTLNWENARQALPLQPDSSPLPDIYLTTRPAELLLIEGEPQLEAIGSIGLSYVVNTEADLFLYGRTFYFLVSGRWFATTQLAGKWSPVTDLPEVFAQIPPDHPRGDVRVSVPGTDEAKVALLEAVIPRKAELSRNYAPPITVSYTDGQPDFQRIDPTEVYQAVNTPYTVLQADSLFYLCYNAAWFVSNQPTGPWRVADQIPQAIYSIPATSSAYNCTHVYAYDSGDDYVTTGYDSGYFNVYTSYTVTYGTGYYYYPYYYYPYYYGYPRSYGDAAWYNPATGNFGARQAVVGPYGGASRTAIYNPETGTYARGRAVWDEDEISRQGLAYNPRSGTGVYTNRYANEDGAWGRSLVKRDDNWVATQTEREGNSASTDFRTSGGASGSLDREMNDGTLTGSGEITRDGQTIDTEMVRTEDGVARKFTDESGNTAGVVRNNEGDLYAGKDGEVYKREDGEWSKRSDGGWEPVEPDSAEQRRAAAGESGRDLGAPEQRDLSQYRQMGSGAAEQGPAQIPAENMGPSADNFDRAPDYGGDRDLGRDNRTRDLDRNYNARRDGFDRHSTRSNRGGMGRRGGGMRRRR